MSIVSQQVARKLPVFGILSTCAPFIGAFLFYFAEWILAASLEIPFAFELGLLVIPFTPLCGIGFAMLAWVRGEPYRAIPWLGLLINLAVLIWVVWISQHGSIGSMG